MIFRLAELNQPPIVKTFFERPIHKKVGKHTISVVVDLMLAAVLGKGTPKHPYFFMQEMKKEKRYQSDPEGQMLAAMIAGQAINNNQKPLYGAYVIGEFWYFAVLNNKEYAKSEPFSVTNPQQLRGVILTLQKLKKIILSDLFD